MRQLQLNKKLVGTITFHGAHNYGSMLQAYALQKELEDLGHNCEIINYRSFEQKKIYQVISGRKGWGPMLKDISHLFFYSKLKKKHKLFERFLRENLITTTKEYNTLVELERENFKYDVIICGSDQIWKPTIADFSWAYFLPFGGDAKRIAYAPSYGPSPQFSMQYKDAFVRYIKQFNAISVREEGTKRVIEALTGIKDIPVVCDPVFLRKKEQWEKIIDTTPIINKPYIFFYTLYADKEMIKLVKSIGQELNLPIVISNFTNYFDISAGFELHLECGPCEFLNLINYATYVCTSSFHGTALSLILNKPLISLRGMSDNRISSLLERLGLQKYSVNSLDDVKRICSLPIYDKNILNEHIAAYRQVGVSFLKSVL